MLQQSKPETNIRCATDAFVLGSSTRGGSLSLLDTLAAKVTYVDFLLVRCGTRGDL